MSGVDIGCRWTARYIERRDPAFGAFECVNPPLSSDTDSKVQGALLAPVPKAIAARIERARRAKRVAPKTGRLKDLLLIVAPSLAALAAFASVCLVDHPDMH